MGYSAEQVGLRVRKGFIRSQAFRLFRANRTIRCMAPSNDYATPPTAPGAHGLSALHAAAWFRRPLPGRHLS